MKTIVFFSCLWIYLISGIFVASATTLSPSFYDWSSTLEIRQPKVLGLSSETTPPLEYRRFDGYVFGKDLRPSSPYYFVKALQENIRLTFAFDQKAKNELRIQIAGERLDEIQRLAGSANIQAITSATNAYRQAMSAVSDNLEVDSLNQMEEETTKHNVVLEQVRFQVSDQAEGALNSALEASRRGTDMVADLKNRPAVPPDLVSRLQSLKSQGLLTAEEVNKLINVKSRVEARQEIGKYVNEGVVSESDLYRLNETTKSYYPDEFYKINETLRFQEMQRLEDRKPDDTTLNKIQSFSKAYKPGDRVPAELRKYWAPVVRLEEIQNTLRPDLIDSSLFKKDNQETKKFNEMVERFKPRSEDIALVNNIIAKNNSDVNTLPPEYQRMYNLGQKYGAQCGTGFNWIPGTQGPAGGYCAPNGSDVSSGPKFDDFTKGKSCVGNMVNAKSSLGACSSFTADCLPPGWNKVDTCVSAPVVAERNNNITCPSNAHFVSISNDPSGGYCIPNYTPDGPRLTTTPGGPYYTNNGRCGPNSNWVPDSVNPQGGYCASSSPSRESQEAGGTNNPNTNTNPSSPSRESQEAACKSGGGTCVSWMNGACGCERPQNTGNNPPAGYGSCSSGQYWNGSGCQNSESPSPAPAPTSPPSTSNPSPEPAPSSDPGPIPPVSPTPQ